MIQGFSVKKESNEVSGLQYTDDTLILINVDKEMAENLRLV